MMPCVPAAGVRASVLFLELGEEDLDGCASVTPPHPNPPGVPITWRSSEDHENQIPSPARPFSVGVPMTWRSSEDDEKEVPSPARLFRGGEGQGEGGKAAPGIFEREGCGEGIR